MPPRHVYVHVPFCARRCSYCDFAIAVRRVVPVDEYVGALQRELALFVDGAGTMTPPTPWEAETLYLGGGTPSRLGGEGVARAIAAVRAHATLTPAAEVTIEANPDDVTAEAVAAWREAGVNRVSLGGQSFDPGVLAWMHRSHDADAIGRAAATIRDGGITSWSLDLIFAVPDALQRDWARDLALALALEPPHISLYGLTVESGTPLGRWVDRGAVAEAPEERYEREFLAAHDAMTAAGLEHYEVSNFARPGERARHNGAYWRHVAYAAFGPGAHGYDGRDRWWNVPAYAEWVRRLGRGESPREGSETLTDDNRVAERVYLGLRGDGGLDLEAGEQDVVAPWIAAGWGTLSDGRFRLTPLGWLRLDSLAAALTDTRSRSYF